MSLLFCDNCYQEQRNGINTVCNLIQFKMLKIQTSRIRNDFEYKKYPLILEMYQNSKYKIYFKDIDNVEKIETLSVLRKVWGISLK